MKNRFDISEFVDTETLDTVLENLAARLKKRRKETGFSQTELAKRSGVSYISVRRLETGGEVSLKVLMKIAETLGCLADFSELFKNPIIKDLGDYKP